MKLLNQQGIGLVQVMVAVAAAGGFTYTIMHNNNVSGKQHAKATFDQQFEAQSQEIQMHLARVENCTATLVDQTFSSTPTALTNIKSGTLNADNTISKGPGVFTIKKPNSLGVYIESINYFTREVNDPQDSTKKIIQDVIRVQMNYGDVASTGVIKAKSKGLGSTSRASDFIIQAEKAADGKVITCFSDETNIVENSCKSLAETQWNPTTKKCEFPNAVKSTDLVDLYTQPDGSLGPKVPPPTRLKTNTPFGPMDVKKSCQCSGKKCSRAPNPCTCGVPSCPSSYRHVDFHNWNRDQSSGFGVDHACMYAAYCEFVSQPVGRLVKP